jgi:hypothetical protein
MDQDRFDSLTRSLTDARSRRGLTRLLGGLTLGGPGGPTNASNGPGVAGSPGSPGSGFGPTGSVVTPGVRTGNGQVTLTFDEA